MIAMLQWADKYNGARMLDGILCEYISVDPLSDKYPSMSHYVHCTGNPLAYIDPDGREIVAVYDGISYTYRREGDEYAFYDRDGDSYMGDDPFMTSLTSALKEIGAGNHGSALLDYLANHENKVIVNFTHFENEAQISPPYSISWNHHSDVGGYCEIDNNTNYAIDRPPFIGLAHEMAHIQDKWKGTMDESVWYRTRNSVVQSHEKQAIHIENLIRNEHNLPLRTHYQHDDSNPVKIIPVDISRVVWRNMNLFNNYIYLPLTPFKK